jgi:hypothetical protein
VRCNREELGQVWRTETPRNRVQKQARVDGSQVRQFPLGSVARDDVADRMGAVKDSLIDWQKIADESTGLSLSEISRRVGIPRTCARYYLEPVDKGASSTSIRQVDMHGRPLRYRLRRHVRTPHSRRPSLTIEGVGDGRPKHSRRDAAVLRNVYCGQISQCLAAAARANWENFSCAECPLRRAREAPDVSLRRADAAY